MLNGRKNALLDPLTLVRQATTILAEDQAIKKLEGNKRQIPGSSTAVNLPRNWIPLLSEIEYDVSAKNFKVPYVDLNNPSKKEILTTDSKNFALAKQALDRQNSALNQYFELHDDQPRLKVSTGLNKIGAISMGSSSLFATLELTIYKLIQNKEVENRVSTSHLYFLRRALA
ncbi:hypothetical protein [Candidatus Regiella insecticola]|uniref:hypothetical protein n=1 Tax=Candidatus Regiella insecticola TaxID=138073 RepID=UPI001596C6F8|nr:hypothetical protein [Candidatus Regiella insecticola]